MAWDQKLKNFGVIKVEGKNVKLYSSSASYITISVSEPVTGASWAGDVLNVNLANGKVRRYTSSASYTTV